MDVWNLVQGAQSVGPLTAELIRVVESQESIATLSLVDGLEEQQVLEALLENSKPGKLNSKLHYLLASPFRYPPLKWGSRFGGTHEPSLFYGSLNIETAFAECAFYRFVFLSGLSEPFAKAVVSQHTSFNVRAHGNRGINLAIAPFSQYSAALRSANSYKVAQQLGAAMRADGVQIFVYLSARDNRPSALNGGVFDSAVFAASQPQKFQAWTCHASTDSVRYLAGLGLVQGRQSYEFFRQDFLVDGKLPTPAP
ncbi:RES family NAD+ phosphorylase [Simiduia curdlanivorans]|uniref:RES family NAD+ phosphorylase n=1 Tax=Simiduia curdlanivorans TaxID=1492769 RepID=A0ABV8V5Z8_9GAMM|nr:RES family NAD+ phosphorylase [Simiduia curdlanivorans]MDN3640541.1 RES family NAD+ phosphorylase [Simiduia curdlanivorans]